MLNHLIARCTSSIAIFWLGISSVSAQQILDIQLPDMEIWATQLLRGNADLYGRGDWQLNVTVALEGYSLNVKGKILFSEKADDFTEIVGGFEQTLQIEAIQRCQSCQLRILENKGSVKGKNIGARGFRWFDGHGLIRRAKIRTDTFGDDVGVIGGRIEFLPFQINVQCLYANAN
jgi:hypothetical protein